MELQRSTPQCKVANNTNESVTVVCVWGYTLYNGTPTSYESLLLLFFVLTLCSYTFSKIYHGLIIMSTVCFFPYIYTFFFVNLVPTLNCMSHFRILFSIALFSSTFVSPSPKATTEQFYTYPLSTKIGCCNLLIVSYTNPMLKMLHTTIVFYKRSAALHL